MSKFSVIEVLIDCFPVNLREYITFSFSFYRVRMISFAHFHSIRFTAIQRPGFCNSWWDFHLFHAQGFDGIVRIITPSPVISPRNHHRDFCKIVTRHRATFLYRRFFCINYLSLSDVLSPLSDPQ